MAQVQAGLGPPHRSPVAAAPGEGEQARLSGREARAGMKGAFMACTKAVCEQGRLASGPCGQSER